MCFSSSANRPTCFFRLFFALRFMFLVLDSSLNFTFSCFPSFFFLPPFPLLFSFCFITLPLSFFISFCIFCLFLGFLRYFVLAFLFSTFPLSHAVCCILWVGSGRNEGCVGSPSTPGSRKERGDHAACRHRKAGHDHPGALGQGMDGRP